MLKVDVKVEIRKMALDDVSRQTRYNLKSMLKACMEHVIREARDTYAPLPVTGGLNASMYYMLGGYEGNEETARVNAQAANPKLKWIPFEDTVGVDNFHGAIAVGAHYGFFVEEGTRYMVGTHFLRLASQDAAGEIYRLAKEFYSHYTPY